METTTTLQQTVTTLTAADLAWLDSIKPDLVGRAENFLESHNISRPSEKNRKNPVVSGSQLRNLLAAAQSGSPFAVLVNFLRYQIGRGNRGWDDTSSGETLVLYLSAKEKSRDGRESLAMLCDEKARGYAPAHRYLLEAQVAAQFFGFLIREYTYRCKLEGTTFK